MATIIFLLDTEEVLLLAKKAEPASDFRTNHRSTDVTVHTGKTPDEILAVCGY